MDNRMQFPPTEIDFTKVGLTGQDHDNYPAPNQQPRYDWWRMCIISLLSNQSSIDQPTQYRPGTIWYDMVHLNIYNGTEFTSIADTIYLKLADESDEGISLTDWYQQIINKFNSIQPRFTFSGVAVMATPTSIPVPASIQTALEGIADLMRPILYINGLLIDPRLYNFSPGCPVSINLTPAVDFDQGDTFTVIIERFDVFVTEDIPA